MAGQGERIAINPSGDELAGQPPNEPWQSYGQGQGDQGWPSYGQPAEGGGNARVYSEPGAPYGDPDVTRVQPAAEYPPAGARGGYPPPAAARGQYPPPGGGYDPPGDAQPRYDPSGDAQTRYDLRGDPHAAQQQAARAPHQRDSRHVRGAKGFAAALFDFEFGTFVTPKIIKVLYLLIVVATGLGALAWTILDFRVSFAFGLITLIVIAPLIFFLTIALYRVVLEFFAVVFQMAEDIRAIRERGDRLG